MAAFSSIETALDSLTSPAATFGLMAALLWAPATGITTWPALARGRIGSTFGVSLAVGLFVFLFARRLGALTWW